MNGNEADFDFDIGDYSYNIACEHCGNVPSFLAIDEAELIKEVYYYENDSRLITDCAPYVDLFEVCRSLFNGKTDDIVEILWDKEAKLTDYCNPYLVSWIKHYWFEQDSNLD
jgi:hypothetical protein